MNTAKIFKVCSEESMKTVSLHIRENMKDHQVVLLTGELGSGKTALVRSFATLMGIEQVMSPTFNLLHIYENENVKISHADLYRLDSIKHIQELNIEEIIEESSITFIEWAEKAEHLFDIHNPAKIEIEFEGECRKVTVKWQ